MRKSKSPMRRVKENQRKSPKKKVAVHHHHHPATATLRKSSSVPTVAGKDSSFFPNFDWKDSDIKIEDDIILRQLTALHWAITNHDKTLLTHLFDHNVDFTPHLRGVTGLSLGVYLHNQDMVLEILTCMSKSRQLTRGINVLSTDNACRKESPLITAARTGQLEVVMDLVKFGADTEVRDGEGRTALWHAIREEHESVFYYLTKVAKVYYTSGDFLSCPLQLACKTSLLKKSGLLMAQHLIRHGANVEYADMALRNALYWSIYNCSGDMIVFLLNAGAIVKPWSWLEDESLPESVLNDRYYHWRIRRARTNPRSLKVICKTSIRSYLSSLHKGHSIISAIQSLNVTKELKKCLSLINFEIDSTSGQRRAREKLEKLSIELK
nr:uncharacterized protein LOC121118710 isoform X1 [Lepeophtheirus salmonis]